MVCRFVGHFRAKGIAGNVPSSDVCAGMRDRAEGAGEWRNPLTSVGLCMSGHAQHRVGGISGLLGACFRGSAYVLAYATDTTLVP